MKNITDKKATFTILIFLSLRNGLFVHRSEQRQFLEQLVEIPLISQKINLNNYVGGKYTSMDSIYIIHNFIKDYANFFIKY